MRLPRGVTARNEGLVIAGVLDRQAHSFVPLISERRQPGVEFTPELPHQFRNGVCEILVLSATETVTGHDDARAVEILGIIAN